MLDLKVLSCIQFVENEVIFSVTDLEIAILCHAPFQADSSWDNVGLSKCKKAPFVAGILGRISYDLNRKHLSLKYNATVISFVVAMLRSTLSC